MKSDIKNYKRIGNIVSGLGGLLAIGSIILLVASGVGKSHNIASLQNEYNRLSENMAAEITDMNNIRTMLFKYSEAVNAHNPEQYKSLFSDRIDRFFLLEDISSEDAYYQMKWYWKTYPKSQAIIDIESASIEKRENGYTIFVPSKFQATPNQSVDILSEIRFDSELKIFYIRDFYASNKDQKDQ